MEDQPNKLDPGKNSTAVVPPPNDAELAKVARIEQVLTVARNAAQRLIENRDPTWPSPRNREEILELVERMAKTPGKYGVTLMPWERKCLRIWNRFLRQVWQKERVRPDDAGPADPGAA